VGTTGEVDTDLPLDGERDDLLLNVGIGTLMTTRESSGLGDLADGRVESSKSESDEGPFLFHNGSEYDFVRTIERFALGLS